MEHAELVNLTYNCGKSFSHFVADKVHFETFVPKTLPPTKTLSKCFYMSAGFLEKLISSKLRN